MGCPMVGLVLGREIAVQQTKQAALQLLPPVLRLVVSLGRHGHRGLKQRQDTVFAIFPAKTAG